MSRKYKKGKYVPVEILCDRVDEIVKAITSGNYGKELLRECTMRIPAEVDHDADLVLAEVARRLRKTVSKDNCRFVTCDFADKCEAKCDWAAGN